MMLMHLVSCRLSKEAVMRYKNKVTGAIIDIPCEIKGDWEPVDKVKAEPKKAPKKSEAKKK